MKRVLLIALVVMPEAADLTEYTRYYSNGWKGWTPVVVGSYMLMDPAIRAYAGQGPGAAAVEGLPGAFAAQYTPKFYVGIFNSRCQFATVYYDESAKQLLATERDGKQQLVLTSNEGAFSHERQGVTPSSVSAAFSRLTSCASPGLRPRAER
ncbi:MAG: hypothetical protein HOP13_14815 [Alphaproteobacteria bacterium]|nr:hypothetical protein [Alphaproteobacteria bacterium]